MGNYICAEPRFKLPYWIINGKIASELPPWCDETDAILINKGTEPGLIIESWWCHYPFESVNFAHSVEEDNQMRLTVSERRNIFMRQQGYETTGIPRSFVFPPEFFDDNNRLIIFGKDSYGNFRAK